MFKWLLAKSSQVNEPQTDIAISIATQLKAALAPEYHVGLTGSQLYGSRPGHTATFKDIDLIVYPGIGEYFSDDVKLLTKLQAFGLRFLRYAGAEYPRDFTGRESLPGSTKENKRVWVMDYNGTRVDVQLRQ